MRGMHVVDGVGKKYVRWGKTDELETATGKHCLCNNCRYFIKRIKKMKGDLFIFTFGL